MAKFFADWRNPALVLTITGTLIFGVLWLNSTPSTVITVGSHSFSESDVVRELKEQAGFQIVGNMITTALFEEYATSKGITVTDPEVDQLVKIQERQLETADTPTSLEDYLKNSGTSMKALRKNLYQQALQTKILVTEKEMRSAVDMVAKIGQPPFTVPPRYKFRYFIFQDENTAQGAIAGLMQNTPDSLTKATALSLDATLASRDQIYSPGITKLPAQLESQIKKHLLTLKAGDCSTPISLTKDQPVVAVFLLRALEPAVKPTYENSNIAAGYAFMMANREKFMPKLREIQGQALDKAAPQFLHADYDTIRDYFKDIKKRNPQLPSVPMSNPAANPNPVSLPAGPQAPPAQPGRR